MTEQKKVASKTVLWGGAMIGQVINGAALVASGWVVLRAENVPTAIEVCAWVVSVFCVLLMGFTLVAGSARNTQKRNAS